MSRRTKLKEPLGRLLLRICRLYYENGQSKTEIARKLRVSVTHVARLLSDAQQRGIVKVTLEAPRFEDLEIELVSQFHLNEAIVVATSKDEDTLRADLGSHAAEWFGANVPEGARIGIGSGRTIFEMIRNLREVSRKISIYSLTALVDRTLETKSVSSDTLANILWFKSRPTATAHRISISLPDSTPQQIGRYLSQLSRKPSVRSFYDSLSSLDFYFYSVSQLRPDSELMELVQIEGKSLEDLELIGIVGDYLFNTVDSSGEHIPCGIERMVLNLPLSALNKASSDPHRRSVLIAGGKRKIAPIKAGLSSGAFNVLITDDTTARELLALKPTQVEDE